MGAATKIEQEKATQEREIAALKAKGEKEKARLKAEMEKIREKAATERVKLEEERKIAKEAAAKEKAALDADVSKAKAASSKKAKEEPKPKTVKMYRSIEDAPVGKNGKKKATEADVNEKSVREFQKKGWSREKFD